MEFLITICARSGSKGIPGKNIKPLNGIPLIKYSIDLAKEFAKEVGNAHIDLSTDSDHIKKLAADFGLETLYKRPEKLSGDSVGKIDTIKDLLMYREQNFDIRYDYILDLDVTSPLRNLNDLIKAFGILSSDDGAYNLFSVSFGNKSPYFNMVEKSPSGYFRLVKHIDSEVLSRQLSPQVFELNAAFYFYKRIFFDHGFKSAITDKSLIYVVPHICFDLDHPFDFEFLTYLMENKKLDFDL